MRLLMIALLTLAACEKQDRHAHRAPGERCTKNWQCIGFDCGDGICMRPKLGAECRAAGQCALGLECDIDHATCKAPVGGSCRDGLDCFTGACTNYECASAPR